MIIGHTSLAVSGRPIMTSWSSSRLTRRCSAGRYSAARSTRPPGCVSGSPKPARQIYRGPLSCAQLHADLGLGLPEASILNRPRSLPFCSIWRTLVFRLPGLASVMPIGSQPRALGSMSPPAPGHGAGGHRRDRGRWPTLPWTSRCCGQPDAHAPAGQARPDRACRGGCGSVAVPRCDVCRGDLLAPAASRREGMRVGGVQPGDGAGPVNAPVGRPAFYVIGRGTGGLGDWVTLLHPPSAGG